MLFPWQSQNFLSFLQRLSHFAYYIPIENYKSQT